MNYHRELKTLMHSYIKNVYRVTKPFPREEMFGITAQLRKAAMSVILNYIEGYARRRSSQCKVYKNFLEISYGSLKESEYLVFFSYTEKYINEADYKSLARQADKIGGMLWGTLSKIN